MKILTALFTALAFLFTPFLCGKHSMAMAKKPNKYPIDAFGCEWDPHFYLDVNQRNGCADEDLALIKQRMDNLNIQRVRMMILPEWYEPENDRFTFDNVQMRGVFDYLDVCEALGIKVTLTWWGAQRYGENPWLAFTEVTDWVTAPNDLNAMADNIVYLLGHLFTEGYTCVDDVILQNEPSYSFCKQQGKPDVDYYIQYYKTVRAKLEAAGLGGKITLVGGDDAEDLDWFKKVYDGLKDVCGKFESHCYQSAAGEKLADYSIRRYVSQRVKYAKNRPFFMAEFGDGSITGAYTAASANTYERGLFLGVQAVNSLRAGSTGSLYWPLHDIYYYDGDPDGPDNGGLMSMGLFAYKNDGNWRVRPTYHAWGLVCNFMLPGSAVYNVKPCGLGVFNEIDAVAAQAPGGEWTVLAANRSGKTKTARLRANKIDGALDYYLYSEGTVTESDELIQASGTVTPKKGVMKFEIPAKSFVVLSSVN